MCVRVSVRACACAGVCAYYITEGSMEVKSVCT